MQINRYYKSNRDILEVQEQIKFVKDTFQIYFKDSLNLKRVSAPLFVTKESCLNDHLSGSERPISFDTLDGTNCEVVQSLAKWKRMAISNYSIPKSRGIYTDMNAIRRDEIPDNTHSYYVDQWDWEVNLGSDQNILNMITLEDYASSVYSAIVKTANAISELYEEFSFNLPSGLRFITTEELRYLYPNSTPKEREKLFAKRHGAFFLTKIGYKLSDGSYHDTRAVDYDDWTLNGDLIVWHNEIEDALELSSMGIRVTKDSLLRQIEVSTNDNQNIDNNFYNSEYYKGILNETLPLTIGGGIGQSRLCMFLLKKAHIGEVQSSVWPKNVLDDCNKNQIYLL